MNKFATLKYVLKKAYYEYQRNKAYEEVRKHLHDVDRVGLMHWQKKYLKYSNLCLELALKKLESGLR